MTDLALDVRVHRALYVLGAARTLPDGSTLTIDRVDEPNIRLTLLDLQDRVRHVEAERDRLKALLNTPETEEFDKALPLEAAHQVERWGREHDDTKDPEQWFWVVGYLAGKALAAMRAGEVEKSKHHTISTAAVLRNWHAHLRSVGQASPPDPVCCCADFIPDRECPEHGITKSPAEGRTDQ